MSSTAVAFEALVDHQLHRGVLQRFLHDLERLHAGQVAQDVDQRQAVHHRAVGGHDEVGAAALDLLEQRQAAAAGAARGRRARPMSPVR